MSLSDFVWYPKKIIGLSSRFINGKFMGTPQNHQTHSSGARVVDQQLLAWWWTISKDGNFRSRDGTRNRDGTETWPWNPWTFDEIYEIRVVELAIHGNVKKNPVGIVKIRQSFFPRCERDGRGTKTKLGKNLAPKANVLHGIYSELWWHGV